MHDCGAFISVEEDSIPGNWINGGKPAFKFSRAENLLEPVAQPPGQLSWAGRKYPKAYVGARLSCVECRSHIGDQYWIDVSKVPAAVVRSHAFDPPRENCPAVLIPKTRLRRVDAEPEPEPDQRVDARA